MIVINLQFWEGDKAQAMALARLLADLEPVKRTDVPFVFSARFDCEHDEETIAYVSRKFTTHKFTSRSKGVGWPAGPNDLFRDSYQFCVERMRDGKMPGTGIMLMEADCIPLDAKWLNKLIYEWKHCEAMVLGAWMERGDAGVRHINGNCIIHKNFWKHYRRILTPGATGWDADCAQGMLQYGCPSRLIWSDYGLGKPGYNEWKGCDYLFEPKRYGCVDNPLYGEELKPVWLHASKIIDSIDCVREKLKLPPRDEQSMREMPRVFAN